MQPEQNGHLDQPDIAGMRAFQDELEKTFLRLQEDGPKLQKRAMALEVSEKSRDGLITVTVGPRGELVRLDIDPRIYRKPDARALADEITETVKQAGAKAREQVVEMFSALMPREQIEAQYSGDTEKVIELMRRQMQGEW
jgi:DNA-binding protein YbaB